MRKLLFLLFLSMLVFVCITGNAMALTLGTNITTWDRMGVPNEDGETEPGTVWDQKWDLEGFFLNGNTLAMVGGYDFQVGVGGYLPGDLFFDVDGDAIYGSDASGSGSGFATVNNTFGYDYVVDLATGEVRGIDADSRVKTVKYSVTSGSNSYEYVSGGSILSSFNANPQYTLGLSQSDVGLLGVVHNAVEIDVSFLGSNIDNFTAHFTYGCGNDNLMGQVPEPATILLSGIGLLGIGFGMRRRFIK